MQDLRDKLKDYQDEERRLEGSMGRMEDIQLCEECDSAQAECYDREWIPVCLACWNTLVNDTDQD